MSLLHRIRECSWSHKFQSWVFMASHCHVSQQKCKMWQCPFILEEESVSQPIIHSQKCMLPIFLLYFLLMLHQFVIKLASQLSLLCAGTSITCSSNQGAKWERNWEFIHKSLTLCWGCSCALALAGGSHLVLHVLVASQMVAMEEESYLWLRVGERLRNSSQLNNLHTKFQHTYWKITIYLGG